MRLFATTVLTSVALLSASPANAAPLSPSAQFAYNVVTNELGTGSCASIDAQIVPRFAEPTAVATFSANPEPDCFVYLSRDLAGSLAFLKTCKVLWNVIGLWLGRPLTNGMPDLCLSRDLFLMNHPDYLRRRFR